MLGSVSDTNYGGSNSPQSQRLMLWVQFGILHALNLKLQFPHP